jgi:hypothetical protein
MNQFSVFNLYPKNTKNQRIEKNIGVVILIFILAALSVVSFNVASISGFSNTLRIILFFMIAIFSFYKINEKSVEKTLTFENDTFIFQGNSVHTNEIYGFDVVNLDDYLEFVILTTNITGQFIYFYLPSQDPKIPDILNNLLTIAEYIEDLNNRDTLHKFLRRISIR